MRICSRKVWIFIVVAFVISGCNRGFVDNGPSNKSAEARSPKAGLNSACYAERCLQTVPFNEIATPAHYKYQAPNLFPDPALRAQYIIPNRMIDLLHVGGSWPLSNNFAIADFMVYSHDRYAIFSPEVASIFQHIRNDLGGPIWVTSGYRSPTHNSQVGGVPWSRHMYGDAVDFTTPSLNYPLLQKLCLKYDASFTLIYTNHIHCDWRKHPLNPAFYNTVPAPPASAMQMLGIKRYGTILPDARIVSTIAAPNVHLSVIIPNEEIEGALVYSWQITTARGVTFYYSTPTVNLPISDAPLKINVLVGGSIHIEKTWPSATN